MSTVFDDPFMLATISAQTRAMSKFGQTVRLNAETTRRLYFHVASLYKPSDNMELIIESVLNLSEPFSNDAERGGYKIAIGMTLQTIRTRRHEQLLELDRRAPPIEAYEQDT